MNKLGLGINKLGWVSLPGHDRFPVLPDELVPVVAVPDAQQDATQVSSVIEVMPPGYQA